MDEDQKAEIRNALGEILSFNQSVDLMGKLTEAMSNLFQEFLKEQEFWAVNYTEPHRDKDQTFLGIFLTEEAAEKAMHEHMASEKARLPHASISESNYYFHQCYAR